MEPRSYTKYFTYSDDDVRWGCYGTTAGFSRVRPHESYPPHPEDHPPRYHRNWEQGRRLGEYAVVYITRGCGTLRCSDQEFSLNEGSAFILRPNDSHWYAPDETTGWDEYWVGFRGSHIEDLLNSDFFDPDHPVLDVGVHPDLVSAFQDIFELSRSEKPGYQLQIGALVIRILAELITWKKSADQTDMSEQIVEKAKSAFVAHLEATISVDEVARDSGLSPPAFRSLFKNYTGMSPYQYFLHMKINRSKELLEGTDLTVKEIAYRLDFKDPYHFSKLFKSKIGESPSRWRNTV
jgi:AraC-like DNA-binding protein